MPRVHVVVVEPKYEGNVGALARAMKNFGVMDLRLVRPCPIAEEARRRAMGGIDILDAAKTYDTFKAAVKDLDLVVGTSGIASRGEKRFARVAITPRELSGRVAELDGDIALVFGREDYGLYQEEIEACDILVTIPADSEYPILNVSHAAAIALYEIHLAKARPADLRRASGMEKEKVHEAFADLMAATEYPAHNRGRTAVMFRRLVGRAAPSKWEFHALMGVLRRAAKTIRRERAKRTEGEKH